MWSNLCTCYFLLLLRVCMRLVSLLRNTVSRWCSSFESHVVFFTVLYLYSPQTAGLFITSHHKKTSQNPPRWSSSSSVSPQFSVQCFSFFLWPGSKAAPRPGGIGSAAAGQPGMEGDSVLSKILPGGAAEQAGKLGEGTTATKEKWFKDGFVLRIWAITMLAISITVSVAVYLLKTVSRSHIIPRKHPF